MKKTLIALIAVLSMVAFAPNDALAACPTPYYYNQQGQCVRDVVVPLGTPGSMPLYNYNWQWQNQYQTYQPTQYQYGYNTGNTQQIQLLLRQLEMLQERLRQLQQFQGGGENTRDDSEVDVETDNATDITDDRATLYGEVDFNNEDEAVVYFYWGRDRDDLDYKTYERVLDEDDDDEEFSARISGLRDDTRYYFRAVAEDEDGRRTYGDIEDFRTDDDNGSSSDDDEPTFNDVEADDITDDSVEISGEVDMNDFRNGIVFFVYGEDEDQVDDITSDYDSYSDVDEDGDDLQKIRVDTDLDGEGDYTADIWGLDDDTDHYFALCVEYEEEDDDDTIECSDTEEFTTDD